MVDLKSLGVVPNGWKLAPIKGADTYYILGQAGVDYCVVLFSTGLGPLTAVVYRCRPEEVADVYRSDDAGDLVGLVLNEEVARGPMNTDLGHRQLDWLVSAVELCREKRS